MAIVGAAAMVVSGVLPWNDAVAAVDANTLLLLFGMMVVAAYLRLSGFFALVTTWAVRRATTPTGVLAAIVVASSSPRVPRVSASASPSIAGWACRAP